LRTLTALLAVTLLLISGCEGEKGPAGPSGNANVVTGTVSTTNEDWLWSSYYWFSTSATGATGYNTRFIDITVPEITSGIISAGAVLVSFEARPGSGLWTPLPMQFVDAYEDYMYNVVYELQGGMIRLHFFIMLNSAGASYPDLQNWDIAPYTFKYTVIEGDLLDSMAAREIDVNDHAEILEYLGD